MYREEIDYFKWSNRAYEAGPIERPFFLKASFLKSFFLFCLAVFFLFAGFRVWEGRAFDNQFAVKVILGEAADQPFDGMVGVGEVIRNRGKIKGFTAQKRDLDRFYSQQPESVRLQARAAWMFLTSRILPGERTTSTMLKNSENPRGQKT